MNVSPKTIAQGSTQGLVELERALEVETTQHRMESWCKLDKTTKLKKLAAFSKRYAEENGMLLGDGEHLLFFLRDCISRSKLHRVKDVIYDREKGEIVHIPALLHNRTTNHFTLKNADATVSVLSGLPTKQRRAVQK